jgi:hypothetical protein
MAQKFTVDPLLLQGTASTSAALDLSADVEDDSSDEEEAAPAPALASTLTPEQKKAFDRKALLERLSKEYEDAAKEAEDGGCTMCSS